MTKPINYDRWLREIYISHDPDISHPNIDTDSLHRWLDDQHKRDREQRLQEQREHEEKGKEITQRRKKLEEDGDDTSSLNSEKQSLQNDERHWEEKDKEIKKKERLRALDIDDLTHDGKISKTSINKKKSIDGPRILPEKERAEYYKKYGMLRHDDDTQKFLEEHLQLVCEETANYLIVWCIDLEMKEEHNLMEHVSHQTMILQFILELSKTFKTDPRECVRPFFARMKIVDKQPFHEELQALRERIQKRAKQKIAEEKSLGPGGLDPFEVLESLPKGTSLL